MTAREFCYWLQGYFEIGGKPPEILTVEQVKAVRAHLAMVFKHDIDPSVGGPEKQKELNIIHNSGFDKDTLLRC